MASIQSVEPSTYEALAGYLSSSDSTTGPPDVVHKWFRLWWDDNPAFRAEMKRGWILADHDKIVGFVGNVPSLLQVGGETATVFSATTWRVLPEYRSQTMGLIFQWTALGKSAVLFATTPSADVTRILQGLHFRLLPPAQNRKTSVLVLNSQRVVAAWGGDTGLAEIAARCCSPAVNLLQKLLIRKVKAADPAPVQCFDRADARFDELWERTKHLYSNTNIRTSSWINWYCFQYPHTDKVLLGYVSKDRLHGYVICQPRKHEKLNLLECADSWVEPGHSHARFSLLHAIEMYARKEKYDLVMFPHFTNAYGAELEAVGFFAREVKVKTNYFKTPTKVDVREDNSYFVSAQGDYGLV